MAHHVMDGALPATWMQGFLSGVAHPILGPDHFLFVIALSLLAWRMRLGWRAVASFLGASLLGVALHLGAFEVPGNESLIALSLVALGFSLYSGPRLPHSTVTVAAAIAGVFHGYAYGESIVGAESGVLLAYLLGLVAVQSVIGTAAYWTPQLLRNRLAIEGVMAKFVGTLAVLTGAGYLMLSV